MSRFTNDIDVVAEALNNSFTVLIQSCVVTVSYTHLLASGFILQKARQPSRLPPFNGLFRNPRLYLDLMEQHGASPVSYTHLDVYKRQVLTRGETQLVFLDTPGAHRPRTRLGDYMVKSCLLYTSRCV